LRLSGLALVRLHQAARELMSIEVRLRSMRVLQSMQIWHVVDFSFLISFLISFFNVEFKPAISHENRKKSVIALAPHMSIRIQGAF
jgi:hypothetical protein